MSLSRLLSLIVIGLYPLGLFFCYLGGEFKNESQETVLGLLGWFALCIACIWFGDEMGGWAEHGMINSPSPGSIVAFMGWLLLVLPGLIFIFVKVIYKKL